MTAATNQAPLLMGMEMECGFAVLKKNRCPLDHETALALFAETVARLEPHLPGATSAGVFLQNGGRFYTDCGHPEITTPECGSPHETVRYKLAAEAILANAARQLNRELAPDAKVMLFGNNFDYLSGTTWGCHESYLHRATPAHFVPHLVPHLVSRIIFTGAGGFAGLDAQFGFLISPRVAWLATVVSQESTHTRGILHTRDESLSNPGYHRAHVICGENNRSQLATYLKLGSTALVILLIEHGLLPKRGVTFQEPLAAMRRFAGDISCKASAPTTDGQALTAIQAQRHYLKLVTENLGRSFMPEWAPTVVELWAETLSRLETGPEAVNTRLDWALKYDLYRRFARDHGGELEVLRTWTGEALDSFVPGSDESIRRIMARLREHRGRPQPTTPVQ